MKCLVRLAGLAALGAGAWASPQFSCADRACASARYAWGGAEFELARDDLMLGAFSGEATVGSGGAARPVREVLGAADGGGAPVWFRASRNGSFAGLLKIDLAAGAAVGGALSHPERGVVRVEAPGARRALGEVPASFQTSPVSFIDPSSPGSCYAGDTTQTRSFDFSVIVDSGFVTSLGLRVDRALTTAEQAVVLRAVLDLADMAIVVWYAQLRALLKITHVETGTASSLAPLSWSYASGTCGGNVFTALGLLNGAWTDARSPSVNWGGVSVFVSPCFTTTFGGVAVMCSYCNQPSGHAVVRNDALDFAHELGHTFCATHTFDGFGVGGIMDYSDGKVGTQVQFSATNKPEICGHIDGLLSTGCASVKAYTSGSCGNGVLEPGEACECLAGGSSCSYCVGCQLPSHIQCSSKTYVMRQPYHADYVFVDAASLADPACCSTWGELAPPRTACGPALNDLCTTGGRCEKLCSVFGYAQCGLDATGCAQKCRFPDGSCKYPISSNTGLILTAAQPGTKCYVGGSTASVGTCSYTSCIAGAALPVAPPTPAPTRRPTTRAPSRMPTPAPSRAPTTPGPTTAPTRAPTRAPTAPGNTLAPTRAPTRAPTAAPTLAPTRRPTRAPTPGPTRAPSTQGPTRPPTTSAPSRLPTRAPTTPGPTRAPTTPGPTAAPTTAPTAAPIDVASLPVCRGGALVQSVPVCRR